MRPRCSPHTPVFYAQVSTNNFLTCSSVTCAQRKGRCSLWKRTKTHISLPSEQSLPLIRFLLLLNVTFIFYNSQNGQSPNIKKGSYIHFWLVPSRPPLWSSGQSSWLQNGDVLCFLCGTNWIYICYVEESRPPLWSSGQSSRLQNGDVLCFLWGTNWIYMLCRRK
jgi:hypothetical protein